MINLNSDLLDKEHYTILDNGSIVETYPIINGHVNPETYLGMKYDIEQYQVFIKSKNDLKIIKNCQKKDEAIALLILLNKKYFERPQIDVAISRRLRELINDKKFVDAECILEQYLHGYYSINQLKDNEICLLKDNNGLVNIIFNGDIIISSARLSRGYVALFNYSYLLMFFDKLFKEIDKTLDIKELYHELASEFIKN